MNTTLEHAVGCLPKSREETTNHELFAYFVSHDLHAPIRTIEDQAGKLLNQSQCEGSCKNSLQTILSASRRVGEIVKNFRILSRLDANHLNVSPHQPTKLIAECLLLMEIEILQTGADIIIEKPMPKVMAHAGILRQVIQNLIGNALKFIDQNVQPVIHISAVQEGNRVLLKFKDNGIGIAPEHLETIFELFERVHDGFPGSGMGLAIVRKGLSRINGHISVHSEPGSGSEFLMDLPGVD